eukprot:1112528-Pelagomonas_calceolata.AAC.1
MEFTLAAVTANAHISVRGMLPSLQGMLLSASSVTSIPALHFRACFYPCTLLSECHCTMRKHVARKACVLEPGYSKRAHRSRGKSQRAWSKRLDLYGIQPMPWFQSAKVLCASMFMRALLSCSCPQVRGKEPEGEIQMYTWFDANLRELSDLIKEVGSQARVLKNYFCLMSVTDSICFLLRAGTEVYGWSILSHKGGE